MKEDQKIMQRIKEKRAYSEIIWFSRRLRIPIDSATNNSFPRPHANVLSSYLKTTLTNQTNESTRNRLNFSVPQILLLHFISFHTFNSSTLQNLSRSLSSMASAATTRVTHCELRPARPAVRGREPSGPVQVTIPKPKAVEAEGANTNIVLQPRLCTLRSYGSDRFGVIKTPREGGDDVSPFFAALSDYIESSKKSQDFEIISGRLAMVWYLYTQVYLTIFHAPMPMKKNYRNVESGIWTHALSDQNLNLAP